jgi:hypothetical protein
MRILGVRRRWRSRVRWRRERSSLGEVMEPLDSKVGVLLKKGEVEGRRERMQRVAVSGTG